MNQGIRRIRLIRSTGSLSGGQTPAAKRESLGRFTILFLCSFLILAIFYGCEVRKAPLRTEPVPRPAAPVISPEELFQKGELELQKFTVPGYRAAVDYFEQALRLKPDLTGAYGRLAVAYGLWAKERTDLGLDNLEQWVKSYYFSLRARDLGQVADYLKASALAASARNFISRREYGEFFSTIKKRFARESAELALSYLRDIFSTGQFKREAINQPLETLDKLLKDNPDDTEALVLKAMVQVLTADDPNLVRVMELKPDWSLPCFLFGLFFKSRGDVEQAEKWFNLTLDKNPEHPRALAELGELAFLGRKYDQAEKDLEKSLALDGEMPRAHLLAGLILREKGEYEKALEHFRAVTTLVPDHEEALYYQALVLVEQADWPRSLETLDSLVRIAGSYEIFGYALRALSFLMLDRLAEAEADSRRALGISSGYYLPYYILGLVYFRKEDWKKAGENFQQSLKVDKTFADGHYYLGQTYLKMNEPNQAREELTRAAELFQYEAKQAELLSAQARERGWTRKAELLLVQKKELEAKIAHCQKLLTSK
ncbi:MAG: tetratricopeptide repeat protein [Candidatus Aminicenantes bacterium]|nr:tetratricopeptide repeat protein [Candidatus Aminicenantes bacterium]